MNSIIENLTAEEKVYFLELANKFDEAKKLQAESGLNAKKIVLSDHAKLRAKERFDLTGNDAVKYFRKLLSNATYICEVVCEEDGSRSHLYGAKEKPSSREVIAIHVSLDYKRVVTAYKISLQSYFIPKHLREHFTDTTKRELKKWIRREKSYLKKIDLVVAESEAEIYKLKFELMKTGSEKKKVKFTNRIEELQNLIDDKYNEIKEAQSKIRSSAKTYLLFI